jgi:hypothetical protein
MGAMDAKRPRRLGTATGVKAHNDDVQHEHAPAPRAAQPSPRLSADDRASLDRLAALANHHLDLLLDGAGRKETLRSAYDLAEGLACWRRRAAPELFAREPGGRP